VAKAASNWNYARNFTDDDDYAMLLMQPEQREKNLGTLSAQLTNLSRIIDNDLKVTSIWLIIHSDKKEPVRQG